MGIKGFEYITLKFVLNVYPLSCKLVFNSIERHTANWFEEGCIKAMNKFSQQSWNTTSSQGFAF